MKSGWTGGQYSLFRVALAAYLFVHLAALLPWGTELFSSAGALVPASASPLARLFPNVLVWFDGPGFVRAFLVFGLSATIPLALGVFDRAAAVFLWFVWACLFGRNPLISNPSLPFIGWILLAHALTPTAPYGSWKAIARVDPRGGWQMPKSIFLAAWVVMSLGYTYSGATKLVSPSWVDGTALSHVIANPLARPGFIRELLLGVPPTFLRVATWSGLALELLFAPLVLFRRLRPWVWLSMVGMHLGLLVLVDFADLTLGMLLLHAFTFDPAWIPPRPAAAAATVFYDGHCGLCHGVVRFALAERSASTAFLFAPLHGALFKEHIPAARRPGLPDSLVVLTTDGAILTRSRAVLHVASALGGLWRVIAGIVGLLPRALLDALYDAVAAVRGRLFARPEDVCPLVPDSVRASFNFD